MIKLIYDYYAEATNYGYNLIKKKNVKKKDGTFEVVDSIISYHGNLASVIDSALREVERSTFVQTPEEISLRQAIQTIVNIHADFLDLLNSTIEQYEKVEGDVNGESRSLY